MSKRPSTGRKRIAVFVAVLVLVALLVGAGSAAAHTPSCHQTAGSDGPHYDDDPDTSSDTASEKNPTLGGDFNENAVDSCSVGNA